MTEVLSPCTRERRGQVDRRGRLTDAALLVGDREDPAADRARAVSCWCGAPAWRARPRRRSGCRTRLRPLGVSHVSRETSGDRGRPGPPCWALSSSAPPRRPGPPGRGDLLRDGRRPPLPADSNSSRHISPPLPRHAQRRHRAPMLVDFGLRTLALHRHHLAARPQQRQAPPGQLVERGHGARHHRIRSARSRASHPRSSARPRTTVTSRARAPSTTSHRKVGTGAAAARSSTTPRSGRAIASGIPGSPAPLPMSAIRLAALQPVRRSPRC